MMGKHNDSDAKMSTFFCEITQVRANNDCRTQKKYQNINNWEVGVVLCSQNNRLAFGSRDVSGSWTSHISALKRAKFGRAPLKSKKLCVSGSIPEATASARLKDLLNRVQGEKERRFPCVQQKKSDPTNNIIFMSPEQRCRGFFQFFNIFIYYLQSPTVQLPLSRWKLEGKRKKKAACADISIWHVSEKSLGTWGLL